MGCKILNDRINPYQSPSDVLSVPSEAISDARHSILSLSAKLLITIATFFFDLYLVLMLHAWHNSWNSSSISQNTLPKLIMYGGVVGCVIGSAVLLHGLARDHRKTVLAAMVFIFVCALMLASVNFFR